MKQPKTVHQIWIGSDVPEREQVWINSVKQWCDNCNIQHKLWSIDDLKSQFKDDPIWIFADTLPDNVRKWVLLCDYFRFLVINPGDMYLDTDFLCTRTPNIDFSSDSLMTIGEYWDGNKAASGLICAGEKFTKLNELKEAVRDQSKTLTNESLNDMCAALGPLFFRNTLEKFDLKNRIINRNEATHIQWKNKGALIHQGAGSWV